MYYLEATSPGELCKMIENFDKEHPNDSLFHISFINYEVDYRHYFGCYIILGV